MTRRLSALALFAVVPTLFSGNLLASEAKTPARADSAKTAEGTTKQLPGGALLHLSPGTRIEFAGSVKLQLAATSSQQTVTQVVKLISGRVDVDIPFSKVPKTAVLLQGPHKVNAVAKGGHSIAIADANRVTIAAVDGDMLAASGNDWKTLPSGLIRGFVGADPAYQELKVPGVPSLRVLHPLLLALGADAPNAHAEAGGVKEANHYQLRIWRVTEKGNEFVRQVEARGVAAIPGLLPGQYQVTARAVDSSGIFGQESAASSLRLVGAELPPGARCEGGSILLGQRARAKLIGAAGLEASYNASQHFVPVPGSVGLSRGESTLLRLREPGTVEEVRVGLEPRSLHADVQITPKHPRWPDDMIEVTVQLFDARGRPVAESTPVKPKVLVNVQPMEVTWLRSENTMHTFIPAPSSRGPWVVRVEIADEFGDPAGRDFIEVAGPDSDRVSAR
ncbi:MAG TPA: hypothetical protein VJV79_16040 [Polyangiaceae bacterium]|nr:hypothetical protein [Polyangiaceae bacterium]